MMKRIEGSLDLSKRKEKSVSKNISIDFGYQPKQALMRNAKKCEILFGGK